MKGESWRAIKDHPGYEVSDLGRVRSVRRRVVERNTGHAHWFRGRVLKPSSVKGYMQVALCSGGSEKKRYVHQLVCEAFNGERPEGLETRHLDGDKTNNTPQNLAWGTTQENAKDRARHGTTRRGPRDWDEIVRNAHLYDRPEFYD